MLYEDIEKCLFAVVWLIMSWQNILDARFWRALWASVRLAACLFRANFKPEFIKHKIL